ncbi:unnamed protein product [Rotaria sordida]|uniref:Uncharacterized protein n=1 Tax=Rotaria sordida TaxID=392033 RepID=A0A819FFX6_9BILA|nr:unnamed protein product [Rotaria sordida]CAF3867878.1 unnamed protein product [Rotaria sordida]
MKLYLLGRGYIVQTNHCPLRNMHKKLSNNRRLDRISLALQQYNIKEIHHVSINRQASVIPSFISAGMTSAQAKAQIHQAPPNNTNISFDHTGESKLPSDKPTTYYEFPKPNDYFQHTINICQQQAHSNIKNNSQNYKQNFDRDRFDIHYNVGNQFFVDDDLTDISDDTIIINAPSQDSTLIIAPEIINDIKIRNDE